MNPSLTLILGVHRSGTSLLTNALVAAGVSAGEFNDTRDPDNPDGYAEHPEVRAFNDRLLAHLGASWDNWGFQARAVDLDAPSLMPWREEAVAILRSAFPGQGPFVLKDPRIATLLPFWERVIPLAGFQLRRIVILRDPAEVAESQRQRVERRLHDFPVIAGPEAMAALWAVTMSEVLAALSDDATLLVGHADLLANPRPTLAAAAAFCGIEADDGRIAVFAAQGVNPGLYRSRAGSAGGPGEVWMAAARALFDDLVRAGTPRRLSAAEARSTAARQADLPVLMRGLPAARESIARMRESQAERQSQSVALEQFIWALGPLAGSATGPQVEGAVSRAVAIAQRTNLAQTSFAVAHAVGQLLAVSERAAEAQSWLESIRPRYGQTEAFQALERRIALLPRSGGTQP